ncbi:hypothetical protein P7C70_g5904, partial [Phenoliferia sp. Uapishka_3]
MNHWGDDTDVLSFLPPATREGSTTTSTYRPHPPHLTASGSPLPLPPNSRLIQTDFRSEFDLGPARASRVLSQIALKMHARLPPTPRRTRVALKPLDPNVNPIKNLVTRTPKANLKVQGKRRARSVDEEGSDTEWNDWSEEAATDEVVQIALNSLAAHLGDEYDPNSPFPSSSSVLVEDVPIPPPPTPPPVDRRQRPFPAAPHIYVRDDVASSSPRKHKSPKKTVAPEPEKSTAGLRSTTWTPESIKEHVLWRTAKKIKMDDWQAHTAWRILRGYDVLVQAPCGSGKSLVFQAVAMCVEEEKKLLFVVTPLNALGESQTIKNDEFDVPSVNVTAESLDDAIPKMEAREVGLVYISPELMKHTRIMALMRNPSFKTAVVSVVVDEAHLVGCWGDKFRPEYARLRTQRVAFGYDVPWSAFSGTTTTGSFRACWDRLGFGHRPFWGIDLGASRPNMTYIARAIATPDPKGIRSPLADIFSNLSFLTPTLLIESSVPLDITPQFACYSETRPGARHNAYALRVRLPPHLREYIAQFTSGTSDDYRIRRFADLVKGVLRGVCPTEAMGVGCEANGIEIVVQADLAKDGASLFQHLNRAGRSRAPGTRGVGVVLAGSYCWPEAGEDDVGSQDVRAADGRPVAKLPRGKGPTAKRVAINKERRAKIDPIQRGIFDRSVCMHTTFSNGFRPETHLNGPPLDHAFTTPTTLCADPNPLAPLPTSSPSTSSPSSTFAIPSTSSSPPTLSQVSSTPSRPAFILGALPVGPRPVPASTSSAIVPPSSALQPGSPMQTSPAPSPLHTSSTHLSPMATDSPTPSHQHHSSPPASPTPKRTTSHLGISSLLPTSSPSLSTAPLPSSRTPNSPYEPEARWTRQHALGSRAALSAFETTWIVITDLPVPNPRLCCSNCNPNLLEKYKASVLSHEERKSFPDAVLILKARRAKKTEEDDQGILRDRLIAYRLREYTRLLVKSKSVYLEWVLETATINALALHCGRFRGNFVLDRDEVANYLKKKHGIKLEMMPVIVDILEVWRGEVEGRARAAKDVKEVAEAAAKATAKAEVAATKAEAERRKAEAKRQEVEEAKRLAVAAKLARSLVPKTPSIWAAAGLMEEPATKYKPRGVRKNLQK